MSKPKILLQLDTDARPSVFDSVVAIDSGVDHLLRYAGVTAENVRELVFGAIFTRGPHDLKNTAIFVGGSQVAAGESVVKAVQRTFLGPLRTSVLMDSNGANTTAAAAVLAVARHLPLDQVDALILGATGPVGQRVARLLAGRSAKVRVASRGLDRAQEVCSAIGSKIADAKVTPYQTASAEETSQAIVGANVVIAAGAAGVELLSEDARRGAKSLVVAVDLNAVPPVGLAGITPHDKAQSRDGIVCYGAIGVGGTKMKIHKAAVARLFESNDQSLDAEEVLALGEQL